MIKLVPGDTFEFLSVDSLTGKHNRIKVLVVEPVIEAAVGVETVLYLPPDRAQTLMDLARAGLLAEDDEQ